jgi:hypothetical protein
MPICPMRALPFVVVLACAPADPLAPEPGGDSDSQQASDTDACGELVLPGAPFGAPVRLSDPAFGSFSPTLAALGTRLLAAWHEFDDDGTHVAYALIENGCITPPRRLVEPLGNAKRPNVMALSNGFAIVYGAGATAIQIVRLDRDGNVLDGPTSLSTAETGGSMPVAAGWGDDVLAAWTDGTHHFCAIDGPSETLAAMQLPYTLVSGGAVNYPRAALGPTGTAYIIYRDPVDLESPRGRMSA